VTIPPLSDEEVLAAVADRDPDAIAVLFDRYGGLAYSLAVRMLADPGAAEDVVQEAFLSVWRQAGRFDLAKGTARGWLMSIVRNRAVDRIRRRRSRGGGHDRGLDDINAEESWLPDVWAEVSVSLDRETITAALAELPESQRQVIDLAYYGGLTHVEIAQRLEVPLGTVKGRIRIGLKRLRDQLKDSQVAPILRQVVDD
jgi:RNA polymerase sigma-70 factor (ECF subfamily)